MAERRAFDVLAARAYRSSVRLSEKLDGLPSLPAIAVEVKRSLDALSSLLEGPWDGLNMDLPTLSTLREFDASCEEFERRIQSQASDKDWLSLASSSQNILRVLGISSAHESDVQPSALEHGDGIPSSPLEVEQARRSTGQRPQVGFYSDVPSALTTPARDEVPGYSIIRNHSFGDAVQIMVSTSRVTIMGSNVGLGPWTRQVGGHLSDKTLREITEVIKNA
ncbi:hypothetical protein BDV06DRAFT_208235 [Aspergillus oleicola]